MCGCDLKQACFGENSGLPGVLHTIQIRHHPGKVAPVVVIAGWHGGLLLRSFLVFLFVCFFASQLIFVSTSVLLYSEVIVLQSSQYRGQTSCIHIFVYPTRRATFGCTDYHGFGGIIA